MGPELVRAAAWAMTGPPGVADLPAPPRRDTMAALQRRRRRFQAGFFVLFLLAPALDLLRFDLYETQLYVLGFPWTLGIDAFMRHETGATETAIGIFVRAFLPALALIAAFLAVAWRYGRLYCGWLCPHFSAVELLNDLLHRAIGRFSVWERHATPRADRTPHKRWWPVFALSCGLLGFAWGITLASYLLPPAVLWHNLLHGTLTGNQARFIFVASGVFTLEFLFARHLFCRFGCAVGFFQSLTWMANPRGMVVAFDRTRTPDCRSCTTARAPQGDACNVACPMRLRPRSLKRLMFSCVQCGRCLQACTTAMDAQRRSPPLQWAVGADAVREALRERIAQQAAQQARDAREPR
jgi:ferredoxin-type protein NapH